MPTSSITRSQKHNANALQEILLDGDRMPDGGTPKFDNLSDTLNWLGAMYAGKLADSLSAAGSSSSGHLADKTIPLSVEIFGSVYSVSIETLNYAKFVDEGVNGWNKKWGSQFSFKKSTRQRGTPFSGKSAFVESMKEYIAREGSMNKITYLKGHGIAGSKETKRESMQDATTKAAITAVYMIKRSGIKPTHYWKKATDEMLKLVAKELGAALKVDIIENLH